MGLDAVFFDNLAGKIFDKIYIYKDDKGTFIYLTFQSEDLIKIPVKDEAVIIYKKDLDTEPVELKY